MCAFVCMCTREWAWMCVCKSVSESAWRNISRGYAQILHSWASVYSRLQYVTASLPALPCQHTHIDFQHMHADTNRLQWCHWICFCLCLSICLPALVSPSCTKFYLPFLCQLGSAYLPNPLFPLFHLTWCVSVDVWCSLSDCLSACLFLSNSQSEYQGLLQRSKPLARWKHSEFAVDICTKLHPEEEKIHTNQIPFRKKRSEWKP